LDVAETVAVLLGLAQFALFAQVPDPLAYTNFGELIVIFDANWDDFDDTLRSRKAVR
jgi:hypothetical protein